MKREKVTMKDIADKLGLSLATVSYVINHSEKEKISHDTRIKVLETAKSMGYVPNQTAKSLANRRSNLVGIIVNLSNPPSSNLKYQYLDLAAELEREIYLAGYDSILSVAYELENIEMKYKHSLEAVFIIDINEKSLKKVTSKYYVPVIFLDCDFDEGLFYKILPDYETAITQAKALLKEESPYLVMDNVTNRTLRERITDCFAKEDIYIHHGNCGLKEFLYAKKNRKGIIIGDILGSEVERYVDNSDIAIISSNQDTDILMADTRRIIISNRQKAKIAVEILKKLITLDYDAAGHTQILLKPDLTSSE
ncbi:LacI family DNA-binding transcriptional regulator [Anaerocolumna xylanovorans]|uniref:Regulatory protein, lacI family n=1 Tax=Anaerocolumna xylanovorans DSM 12503 TaxID=1121345 RepID=A0A1M7XX17_9FIRM|nr:LacI family DNA-binding transcriptional regulator [Anaerocolumna xylanovorans]SHO43362.1 regulatory protein, lacI family [Anaerocolumna xylanovorans DSM 12503]